MKAMILAAGRGQRLGYLTQQTPKPLLDYKGKTFIEYRLLALAKAGVTEVVINTWYKSELIKAKLGNGNRYGVTITYSEEQELLETGGGIKNALPLLGDEPFILTNSDLVTDYDYTRLLGRVVKLAHLVLVPNPAHCPQGDFCLQQEWVREKQMNELSFTYSGIAVINPRLFNVAGELKFPLVTVLKPAITQQQVSGECYPGLWIDIGRPEDLHAVKVT